MKHIIEIQNLKCGGCAKTIENNLRQIDNLELINIEIETGSITVKTTSEDALSLAERKLQEIGDPIIGDKNSVITKAKSFVSCATGKMSK